MESFYSNTKVRLAFNTVEPEGCVKTKPPIIFLHGVMSSKESWNDIPQFIADATKRKVYAIDARNHGNSDWTDEFNMDLNADDVLNFMDSVNAPTAIIVGHSMGGKTGTLTALKAPERIEKLVVEEFTLKKSSPEKYDLVLLNISLARAAISKVPVGVDEETAKSFIANFVHEGRPPQIRKHFGAPNASDYNGRLKRTADGNYSFKVHLRAIEEFLKEDKELEPEYIGIYVGPTCFIYGKISPFQVGSDEQLMKQFFPNAEFVGIDNASHLVHVERPIEYKESLLKFLLEE